MNQTEMFPKKLRMIEQQKPYREVTFVRLETGYYEAQFPYHHGLTEYIIMSKEQFVRSVVNHKNRNYKAIEVEA